MLGKWVFYAFIILVIVVILSRAHATSTVTNAFSSGGNTLIRAITGQNTQGTALLGTT